MLIFLPFKILFYLTFNIYFAIFLVIYAIIAYFVLKKIFKIIEKYAKADKELYNKYKDYMRNDWCYWDFNKLYIGAVLFSWIKLTGVFLTIFGTWIAIKYTTYGINIDEAKKDPNFIRKIKLISRVSGKMFVLSCGVFVNKIQVDVDYSKYLGKDYTTNKESATICNHVSWLDILILMGNIGCGFITSKAIASYPFIGTICTCLGSIYVDRLDSKDKSNVMIQLEQKMKEISSGENLSSLAIFPEGTTTNGSSIIPFKKGAFAPFLSLRPFVLKIKNDNISLAMEIIEISVHLIIVCCIPYHAIELYQLPVFTPNEFFKNYCESNGDKPWVVYSEVMRELMCNASGIKKGTATYEQKVEVLKILRNN